MHQSGSLFLGIILLLHRTNVFAYYSLTKPSKTEKVTVVFIFSFHCMNDSYSGISKYFILTQIESKRSWTGSSNPEDLLKKVT